MQVRLCKVLTQSSNGQLTVGFNANSNLIFGHNNNDLNVPVSRSSDFRVMTFRFSTQEGMQAFHQ